tara:strand:+ start:805 stop:2049 length:1245 start_codon:yes stop_codon:yes gene_type:complete
MDAEEFLYFKDRVGKAVALHPKFKSSQASLEAAYAQVKGSQSYLRPQFSMILDSNNAISRKYADDPTNLVERSQADHKTNVRFTINQLLYDFGATQYDVSRNEALAKASRAQLSSTILELLYLSIRSYIDVASYTNFEKVVENSYLRHKAIKERIKTRVDSGLAAGRELSRAEAREAEAFAKLTSVRQNLGIAISRFRIYFPEGELPEKLPLIELNNSISLIDSRDLMLKKNPDVLQANEELVASTYKTKNAVANSRPRLDLELKKQHFNVTKESDEFDFYSGINFKYDIYTGGRNEAYQEQTRAEEKASINDRDDLIQTLLAELKEAIKNLNLIPDRLNAFKNAYLANKRSQYYALEEFKTSNAVLLDLLQTERDFLDSSESMIETLRSSEIQKYTYLKITGELGETFEIILN